MNFCKDLLRKKRETITAAIDLDLIRLGIVTSGDRVRLREACRKRKKELHQGDTNDNNRAFEYGDGSSVRNTERLLLFRPMISGTYRRLA